MKIKFPQRGEFVCTSEFEISKHLSQKVLEITFLFATTEGKILLKYCIHLISAATEARPEQIAADAGGGRGTSPRFPRSSPRPSRSPRPPSRPGRPPLGLPVPGGVRGLAAGRDAAHLVLRGGPGAHDGGGQAPRAAPPRRHGRALRREGEGAGQAAGAAG